MADGAGFSSALSHAVSYGDDMISSVNRLVDSYRRILQNVGGAHDAEVALLQQELAKQRDALAGEKSRFAQEEERLRRQLAEKRVELERLTDQVDLAREQSQAWERQAMEARQALADRIRADNERAGHRAVVEVQTELGDGEGSEHRELLQKYDNLRAAYSKVYMKLQKARDKNAKLTAKMAELEQAGQGGVAEGRQSAEVQEAPRAGQSGSVGQDAADATAPSAPTLRGGLAADRGVKPTPAKRPRDVGEPETPAVLATVGLTSGTVSPYPHPSVLEQGQVAGAAAVDARGPGGGPSGPGMQHGQGAGAARAPSGAATGARTGGQGSWQPRQRVGHRVNEAMESWLASPPESAQRAKRPSWWPRNVQGGLAMSATRGPDGHPTSGAGSGGGIEGGAHRPPDAAAAGTGWRQAPANGAVPRFRDAMPAHECEQCRRFYEALDSWGLGASDAAAHLRCPDHGRQRGGRGLLQHAGRHRAVVEPALTPPGFWNMGFADEDEL